MVAIVPASQEDTAEHGKNSDRERTNCEHEMRRLGQHGSCLWQRLASIGIARDFGRWVECGEMSFRNGFYAGLVLAAIWGVYLFRLWQPQRQIELHNLHLLARIERHDWKPAGEFIGDTYQDQWGNNRALLLERLPQVFRALGNTQIEVSDAAIRREQGRGYWTPGSW